MTLHHPRSLVGQYSLRTLDLGARDRLADLVREHGAQAAAGALGVSPHTLQRVVRGQPIRRFVADGLTVRLAELDAAA